MRYGELQKDRAQLKRIPARSPGSAKTSSKLVQGAAARLLINAYNAHMAS